MVSLKRLLSIALTFAMILLLVSSVWLSASAETMPFKDVPAGKWFTDAVQYCYSKGYVGGYEDKTFRPNNRLTRAEMAVIMNKKLGLKESDSNSFKDVAPGKWYTDAILHCVKAGVMSGYNSTTFGTNDDLPREQGAVILAKAFNVEKVSGRTTFADDSVISSWAVGSVKAMAEKGLISGMGSNRFEPKTPLTRAMMCQIIYAAEQKTAPSPSATVTPSPSNSPQPSSSPKPTENPIPIIPDDDEKIRAGTIVNTTTAESWDDVVMKYIGEEGQRGFFRIDVDNDANRELLLFGDRGSGNEKLITYHNGTVSVLPLNGSALAYVPKGNAILVGEYEEGTYFLSTYTIQNGKWTIRNQGSFQDPPGGPQTDKDGNDVYVNYKWNGKSVSEEAFYLSLIGAIDVTKLETIENDQGS